MNLSILLPDGNISTIQLPEEEGQDSNQLAIDLIVDECGIGAEDLKITLNGKEYSNSTSNKLSSISFSNGDMVKVERIRVSATSQGVNYLHQIPGNVKPDELVDLVIKNPHLLAQFQSADAEMYSAISKLHGHLSGGSDAQSISPSVVKECVDAVRMLMMTRAMNNHKVIFDKRLEEQKIFADPYSEASQKRIAEQISQQNIQANMDIAIEEMPESFARVHMLYVNLEINNCPIKAFVDSGAQSTIMSVQCAERCGLMRLVDKRFAGEARGVGKCKILGKVHIAQMKLGKSYFSISLTVLENNDVDFLFGLDMLKRHRCCIDLQKNVLRIMGSSDLEEVEFLPESELPRSGAFGREEHNASSEGEKEAPPAKMHCSESDQKVSSSGDGSEHEKISHLMSLGFPEAAAIAALRQSDGDAELAANILFASYSEN